MTKLKKFSLLTALFLASLVAIVLAFLIYASYGEGYRVGEIIKMSKKGVVFKTWEGEMTLGFLEQGQPTPENGGVATRLWYFTVPSGETRALSDIDQAIQHNKRVKVYYREKYRILPWLGDTRHMVYKVEAVE